MKFLRSHFLLRFAKDYDYPIHKPVTERTMEAEESKEWIEFGYKYLYKYRFKKCIHGHFLPYKYSFFLEKDGKKFITWLRDPIERLVSHYHFWFRIYGDGNEPKALHRRVVEENWSFEKFAFSEEMQNFYSQYLWKFPVEQFDFIGIMQHYEEDLQYFAQYFLDLSEVKIPKVNVSPAHANNNLHDEGLIQDLKTFHARDYEIYNYALEERQKRQDFLE